MDVLNLNPMTNNCTYKMKNGSERRRSNFYGKPKLPNIYFNTNIKTLKCVAKFRS